MIGAEKGNHIMCGNNNGLWIIIILIILFCGGCGSWGCGSGCGGGCNTGCGGGCC